MAQPHALPLSLTDREYHSELDIVIKEVYEVNHFYQIMEEMNDLLLHDEKVFMVANEQADFWQAHRAANQIALFMSLWRIFDTDENSKSVHRLIRITRENLHLFSKSALGARRMGNNTTKPEWFDIYMQSAWEPQSAADLKFLKDALKPHASLFRAVYEPIRHNIYGHRLMSDSNAAIDLFPRTNRGDIGKIVHFLQVLTDDLEHLYINGREPKLNGDFTAGNQRIRENVKKVMHRLAGSQRIMAR